MLPNGHDRTKAGSTREVAGKHSGIFERSFDWLEKRDASFDCVVERYPEDSDGRAHRLPWHGRFSRTGA